MDKGVKEYLEKHQAACLVIDMIQDETSSGCCCGITKKYYTPYVRISSNKDNMSKEYVEYEEDGITVFIVKKALTQVQGDDDMVNIYLEKVLFSKKLNVNGIKAVVD